MNPHATIRRYYQVLARSYGPQKWWPARTRFEVIVGAFLTQNTAWTNVERALGNLRRSKALSVAGIRRLPLADLQQMVRPAGYFRQKAAYLKNFVAFLDQRHAGSLRALFSQPTAELREQLLSLKGVGPETADSVLLYAGGHPVFVVDAYARRILHRHRVFSAKTSYESIREVLEEALADGKDDVSRAAIFNEAHALIVEAGKRHCQKEARCQGCPLEKFLPNGIRSVLATFP